MNLRNTYNHIRIAAGDKWKTAFCTKLGLLKYIMIPLGLTNGPVSFQEIKDSILQDMAVCIWYFDNIHINAGNTEAEQHDIVEKVRQQFVKYRLAGNLLERDFHGPETICLDDIISGQEVHIVVSKVESMSKWPNHTYKTEV